MSGARVLIERDCSALQKAAASLYWRQLFDGANERVWTHSGACCA
jgi:hypothetical protein